MRNLFGAIVGRRALLLALFVPLLLLETLYFSRQCGAGILRLRGEWALFRNDHKNAWRHYQRALKWGGDRDRLETDIVELLLFGLDQSEAGMKIDPVATPRKAIAIAHELIARRIHERPYDAYYWSLASDIYLHLARQHRRENPLDLSTLSEDPLANLSDEDRLGINALESAARLEPSNYLYHDLLAEKLLEVGSAVRAADHARLAVVAYPVLAEHRYLLRPDIEPEVLEAALQGFEEALRRESMVPQAAIECDAGILVARHGQPHRALPYLEKAVEIAPDFYEARFHLALIHYNLGEYREAIPHFEQAGKVIADEPWPRYYLGLCYLALGDLEAAITQFRSAKEKAPRAIDLLHKLGETLEVAGKVKEAETQFVAAAHLNPDRPLAWSSLLAFYMRHHDLRAAFEICSRLNGMKADEAFYKQQCARLEEESR